ncbi:MAG TPA: hypothetical protein VNO79_06345 [Actinomycetota bacterium]|nr:hypothetical protein [Actinomycetota bacterium]
MWAFPLVAALIALGFAGLLARRFAERRRPFDALWAVALLLYAAASGAVVAGLLAGWSAAAFRVYWALGAVLNVPYLAGGEIVLLFRDRRVLRAVLLALLFVSGFAVARVGTAPLDPAALDHDLPLGREVFGGGSPAHRLAQLVSYPSYVVLLAGCAWSAWRMRGRRELRDRFLGTLGIAAGATVVAVASGVGAGFQVVPVFSVGLALGIAVMFWGFLRASRPVPARV